MINFLVLFVFVQQLLLLFDWNATAGAILGDLVLCLFSVALVFLFLLLLFMVLHMRLLVVLV